MHRIDTEGNKEGKFYDGTPSGTDIKEATVLDASWLNAVQEEICRIITDNGIELKKGKNFQLGQAVGKAIEYKLQVYKEVINKILNVVKREIEREGDELPENV